MTDMLALQSTTLHAEEARFIRLKVTKYSFSQRIINEWNKLSADCVQNRQVSHKDGLHCRGRKCTTMKSMDYIIIMAGMAVV